MTKRASIFGIDDMKIQRDVMQEGTYKSIQVLNPQLYCKLPHQPQSTSNTYNPRFQKNTKKHKKKHNKTKQNLRTMSDVSSTLLILKSLKFEAPWLIQNNTSHIHNLFTHLNCTELEIGHVLQV